MPSRLLILVCATAVLAAACGSDLAMPADAQRTPSGLAYKVLKPGTGTVKPTPASPLEMRLGGLIPGWVEGMQMMVAGEKRRFWIPGNLAYDNSPRPDAPKGTLVFDIELIEVR